MAKMKRPIGDQVSGKIGNVVFVRMNDQSYVRAAPQRKKTEWTPEQQLHRQRFSKAVQLWRQVKSDQVQKIWNQGAVKMNGYALFIKANMPAFALDGTLLNPAMLQLSTGKLSLPQKLQVMKVEGEGDTIAVSWQNDPHLKGERLRDELMGMSYGDGEFSQVTATGILRSALQGSFTLPPKPANATHVFLFMASADRKAYSGSCAF